MNGVDPSGLMTQWVQNCVDTSAPSGEGEINVERTCFSYPLTLPDPWLGLNLNQGRGEGGSIPNTPAGEPQSDTLLDCSKDSSYWSKLAGRAENAALVADGTALASGVAAGLTAPTGIGAAVFGGVAVGAVIAGRLSSGVAVVANLAAGNNQAAAANAIGFVAGSAAGRGYMAAQRTSSQAGNAADAFGARVAATGTGTAVGQGICR